MAAYPELESFFSAYFHQDWTMEHDTTAGVVDYYRQNEAVSVPAVREQLAQLLQSAQDEDQLARQVQALGCEYAPDADGLTYRQWLEGVQALLQD